MKLSGESDRPASVIISTLTSLDYRANYRQTDPVTYKKSYLKVPLSN